MVKKLFAGTVLGFFSLLAMTASGNASPSEPVTVDVYGSSYSVELDHEATDRVLKSQPWWGNKVLASELCEALVYQGEDAASVGYNTMEINGTDYIQAYLVMPLATCSGPVLISEDDIGQMTGGTFFVVSGHLCLTSAPHDLAAQVSKSHGSHLPFQNVSVLNCDYFNDSIFY